MISLNLPRLVIKLWMSQNLSDRPLTVPDDPVPDRCSIRHCSAKLSITGLLLLGSVNIAHSLQPQEWASPHYRDHPLVGSLWTGDGDRSTWADLTTSIRQARFVLIGEVHTNLDHHRFQAAIIRELAEAEREPVIVWEMIPTSKQPVLEQSAANASALGDQLSWSKSGWPDWTGYQPIAEAAAQYELPMRAAGLSRDWLRTVASEGLESLPNEARQLYGLDLPFSTSQESGLTDSLRIGHCHLLPEGALSGMGLIQRLRDGAMAIEMSAMSGTHAQANAVLIAGNEHVRKDRGVQSILSQWRPNQSAVSIGQVEVSENLTDPNQAIRESNAYRAFDFVLFTPKAQIKDHCAELIERFSRKPVNKTH